jgi:tungstate transport system substrate-binding protein
MKTTGILAVGLMLSILASGTALGEDMTLKMSTTTSTEASGLLDVLLPALEEETGIKVKVIAKGTGAAIRDGMDGNVDLIFVHDLEREEAFVQDGYGTRRYAVMHNDFIIIGPENDPAAIKGMTDGAAALQQIAAAGAVFISRGDDSGTHAKEQALWQSSGIPLTRSGASSVYPEASSAWYLSVGQGMGKTLTLADEKQAYTLADRGTYIKYKYGRDIPIQLSILCEGGDQLANPYGIIPVSPDRHPHVRHELAEQMVQWLISARGQEIIAGYKLHDQQLFFPDALTR